MADTIEVDSSTWRAVKAWVERERETTRAQLEAPGLDQATTEFHRGRLANLRALLAEAEPKILPPPSA